MASHRARLPVAYPHAPPGTCKHCGRTCDPTRRTHDECRHRQSAANDYRAAAGAREGAWQVCVDCGAIDGDVRETRGKPGQWEVVKIQRDHPQELVDNGPREWTVARCPTCHNDKTQREKQRRMGAKAMQDKVASARSAAVRWALGGLCLAGAWWWHEAPPTVAAPSLGENVSIGWVVAVAAATLWLGGSLVLWFRWRLDRRRKVVEGLRMMVAKHTHTPPEVVRIKIRRWRGAARPLAGRCTYHWHFDDAEGSRGRALVEELLQRKAGGPFPLVFTWTPHENRVAWRPRAAKAPDDDHTTSVEPPRTPAHDAVQVNVQTAVAAMVKGQVDFLWGAVDAVGPLSFTVAYPSTFPDDVPEQRFALVSKVNSKAPGRWRATWDTEGNRVRFDRRPPMPTMLRAPVPADDDTWRIPFGVDERGQEVAWPLKRAPHCLVIGPTGSGKTVTLRSIIAEAAGRGFTVLAADPKRIELTGLRGWPNVRVVASSVEDMIALVDAVADEMDDRYERIEAGEITEDDLEPILFVLDEATEFIQRVNAYWKANKPRGVGGTEHPVVERHRSMARLGRSGRVHLVTGIQRPDAKVFGGEARDQYTFRVGVGPLSQDAARMLFGRSDVGRDVPDDAKGRATVIIGEEGAMEVQTHFTPNPRRTEYPEDPEHLAALAAAAAARPSGAVAHLTESTVRAKAAGRDLPRPALSASPGPEWVSVDLDDLTDGDRIRVDLDGTLTPGVFVQACENEDGGVDVEFVTDAGEPRVAWVDADERIDRAQGVHTGR